MSLSFTTKVGLVAGLLFFAHALVPGSNGWPLIWPTLGGAIAVWMGIRRSGSESMSESIKRSASAGLVAGVFFVGATILALLVLGRPEFADLGRQLGSDGSVLLTASVVSALVAAAAIGLIAAVVTGLIAHPIAKRAAD